MITPRLRPRLEMTTPLAPGKLFARVEQRLANPECPCRGLATEHQIDLRIREADRHFWSPQLTVIIEPHEGGSLLTGHFGPNGNVWTMFMACYGFVMLSALTGIFFGLSQLVLDRSPWALWSVPVGVVLVALIYVAAGIGQRMGHDQVDVLQGFLEGAIVDDAGEAA